MPNIILPDGKKLSFKDKVTGLEIASKISKSLSKQALIMSVNGDLKDLSHEITKDSKVRIITPKDKEGLDVIRHDAAHIMAMAVQELFPGTQVTIGPVIENGFYYDFARKEPFTKDDLKKIEKKMAQIVDADVKTKREVWERNKAIAHFKKIGEKYKAEIIESIPENEELSVYHHGDSWHDLCRGPHLVSSGKIGKAFKLTKVSGAYWRGDSNNEMLQRIYGTCWSSKKELDEYLHRLEEAEKRDHRRLGKELELFQLHPESPGAIFWLPKGATVYNTLAQKARKLYLSTGYNEVRTPLIYDKSLWKTSGHWEHYRDDMFTFDDGEGNPKSGLKPMNCPAHMLIFKSKRRSYRELPFRLYDQGVLHRNERTGALSGLVRAIQFSQDDAHNFVTKEQIEDEHNRIIDLISRIYQTFDLDFRAVLSTRDPEKFMGDLSIWNQAEGALEEVLKNNNLDFGINPGDAAFYGPKLDFYIRDSLNREHQCATIQLDFQLPERFDLSYTTASGTSERPVVIHRALYGSLERFIGLIIEHYAGAFPMWLAPVQCVVMTISERFVEYGREIHQTLISKGVRSEFNDQDDKIGAKIRQARLERIPYMLVVGEREETSRTVSLRSREDGDLGAIELNSVVNKLVQESDLDF